MGSFQNTVVLIPAYMPSKELVELANALIEKNFSNIVVVDDGSGNEYSDVFGSLPTEVTVLRHSENKGKGMALKTGLRHIYENISNCIGVITCDADGQHRLRDICKIADALRDKKDTPSLILGSRAFKGEVPLRSAFGNTVTRAVYFLASGVKVHDTQTGLRAFSYDMIPVLMKIPGERYDYEINMLLEIARKKIHISETEIETVYFDGNKSSHFHVIRDSVLIYGNIIKFSLASLVCFGIDLFVLLLFRYLTDGLGDESSLLISVICARVISSFVNYTINRHVVFKNSSKRAIFKYYALALCILCINYGLLYTFNLFFGITLFWAKLATEIILFFVSYTVQKKLIFRSTESVGVKECV